jgi:hypothetical protein
MFFEPDVVFSVFVFVPKVAAAVEVSAAVNLLKDCPF